MSNRSSPIQFSNDVPVEKVETPWWESADAPAKFYDPQNLKTMEKNFTYNVEVLDDDEEEDGNVHQAFHTIPMEEVPYAAEGVRVFDSGPHFHDRFTVIFPDNSIFTMSSNAMAQSPHGVCEYAGRNGSVPRDVDALAAAVDTHEIDERLFSVSERRIMKQRIPEAVQVNVVPLEVGERIRMLMV